MTGILAAPVDQTAASARSRAAELVARRVPGHSLEAPFYSSREIYELDIELIFGRHWIFVAAEAEIPEEGDYVTVELGGESVIVVRDDDGDVRAFRNVCRHRGAKVVTEEGGCGATRFKCPYHAWSYNPDGSLRGIPFEEGFDNIDRDEYGLTELPCDERHGLIWAIATPGEELYILYRRIAHRLSDLGVTPVPSR